MEGAEDTQSHAAGSWLRRSATLRRRFLTWAPAAILGLWLLCFASWQLWHVRSVASCASLAALILSLLWLLCWALADVRSKVSRRNLLLVWLIWVLPLPPMLWGGEFGLTVVVGSFAVAALTLAWLRGHCQDKWDRQDHAGGELSAGRAVAQ